MKIKEFSYRNSKGSIYIYGTTVGGKIFHQIMKESGQRCIAFCDRAGKYEKYDGLPVVLPTELPEGALVVICVMRSFDSVCVELESVGFEEVYCCVDLLNSYTISDFNINKEEIQLAESFLKNYHLYALGMIYDDEIVLPALEVFITEKCTLRCRDCSHLISYYEAPQTYDVHEITEYISKLLLIVKNIEEVLILGGEPLRNPDLDRLLCWLYINPQIGTIRIITNATVYPSKKIWQSIVETHTEIRLSDYGELSSRLSEIMKTCDEQGILYSVCREAWSDMGKIENHNYSEEELKKTYRNCPFTYVFLLLKNRLFRCAHIAHLNNLKCVKTSEHDSIDLENISTNNISENKKRFYSLLTVDYLEGCNYCNGYNESFVEVEPAIQLEKGIIPRIVL